MRPKPAGVKVQMLKRDVAERIAAGEVIERPASIVKELVENSLDAGATRLRVDLRNGGVESLRVIDDGAGMSRDDLELAVQRFATSKIAAWEDLDRLHTYGFRGEALPSVAAISRVEIVTREKDAPWGWRMLIRGGEVQRLEEAGTPPGTSITVTELFYNTPARKKFLKGPAAEASRIHELLAAMSLAAPHLHLRLTHQERDLLDLPPVGDAIVARLRRIWDVDREQNFMPVEMARENLRIDGWLSTPDLLWPNRRRLLLFVNRRLISMPALSHAIADGLGAGRGRFPVGVLHLDLPTTEVDVNVHPMKSEVRLRDAESVLRRVREAVGQAVRRAPTVPLFAAAAPPAAAWRTAPPGGDPFAGWPDPTPAILYHEGRISIVRDDRLWVIDPHVWHECRLREQLQGRPPALPLDFPLMLERAESPVEVLQAFGITVEAFGPQTWLVRSLPAGFERLADAGRMEAVLRQPDFLEAAPCAAAIPPGERLSGPLLQQLLAELTPLDLERVAHGRPSALRLDTLSLNRLHTGELASRQEALQP